MHIHIVAKIKYKNIMYYEFHTKQQQ